MFIPGPWLDHSQAQRKASGTWRIAILTKFIHTLKNRKSKRRLLLLHLRITRENFVESFVIESPTDRGRTAKSVLLTTCASNFQCTVIVAEMKLLSFLWVCAESGHGAYKDAFRRERRGKGE